MCTERTPDEVVVCDVAVDDVRRSLAAMPGIDVVHLPYAGNLVRNRDPQQRLEFRRRLSRAIAAHGGTLPNGGTVG